MNENRTDRPPSDSATTASAVLWDWRYHDAKPEKTPLWRSLLMTAIAWLIAALLVYFDHPTMAITLSVIAAVMLLLAIVWPKGHGYIEAAFARLAHWIGILLTWLLLPPFFFLFFTSVRLGRRFFGKSDSLNCRFDSTADSYWSDRRAVEDVRSHLKRQF